MVAQSYCRWSDELHFLCLKTDYDNLWLIKTVTCQTTYSLAEPYAVIVSLSKEEL